MLGPAVLIKNYFGQNSQRHNFTCLGACKGKKVSLKIIENPPTMKNL